MGTIFKKEFRSYFTSPIGYVVIAVIIGLGSINFVTANLVYGMTDLTYVFNSLLTFSTLAISLLTMRIFSEEKRQKTDQLLFTSPVSLTGVVVGKFLAALFVYVISISITLVFALVINFFNKLNWVQIMSNYIGLILVGGIIIAIGILISCVTESQMVAAFGTFGATIVILFMDGMADKVGNVSWLVKVIDFMSIKSRYSDFTNGILAYDNIIFFLSMQILLLFLAVKTLDSRRWK